MPDPGNDNGKVAVNLPSNARRHAQRLVVAACTSRLLRGTRVAPLILGTSAADVLA